MRQLILPLILAILWLAMIVGVRAYDAAVKARVQHQQRIEGSELE